MSAERKDTTTNLTYGPGTKGFTLVPDDSSPLLLRCLSLDLDSRRPRPPYPRFRRGPPGHRSIPDFSSSGRRLGRSIGQARRPFRWCGLPAGPQSDRFRFAPGAAQAVNHTVCGYCGCRRWIHSDSIPWPSPVVDPYHHCWSSTTRTDNSNAGASTTQNWMPGLRWRSSATVCKRPCPMHRMIC